MQTIRKSGEEILKKFLQCAGNGYVLVAVWIRLWILDRFGFFTTRRLGVSETPLCLLGGSTILVEGVRALVASSVYLFLAKY